MPHDLHLQFLASHKAVIAEESIICLHFYFLKQLFYCQHVGVQNRAPATLVMATEVALLVVARNHFEDQLVRHVLQIEALLLFWNFIVDQSLEAKFESLFGGHFKELSLCH